MLSTLHHRTRFATEPGSLAADRAQRQDVGFYGERRVMDRAFVDWRVADLMERRGSDFMPPERLPVADQMRQMRQPAGTLGGRGASRPGWRSQGWVRARSAPDG